jgi:hypothetical protein
MGERKISNSSAALLIAAAIFFDLLNIAVDSIYLAACCERPHSRAATIL